MNIIIGVTGHRNINTEAIPKIQEMVSTYLDAIIDKHPRANITLLSPLAVGADQIVARIALEKGLKLHVPLPMPLSEYIQDFNEKEREQLESMLFRASRVWVPSSKNLGRPESYLMAGSFIAQSSDYVLALWDGIRTNEQPGGTAHIVRLIKEQGSYAYPVQNAKQPVLHHILAPRNH